MLKATLKKYHKLINTQTLDFAHSVLVPSRTTAPPPFFSVKAAATWEAAAFWTGNTFLCFGRRGSMEPGEREGQGWGKRWRLLVDKKEEEDGRATKDSAVTTRRRVERRRTYSERRIMMPRRMVSSVL